MNLQVTQAILIRVAFLILIGIPVATPAWAVGWCRDPNGCPGDGVPTDRNGNPMGNNSPRNSKTKACAPAGSLHRKYQKLCSSYYSEAGDPDAQAETRTQLSNLRNQWEGDRGRCHYSGPVGQCGAGGADGGSGAGRNTKNSGHGSDGGTTDGGGGGRGDSGGAGGGTSPAGGHPTHTTTGHVLILKPAPWSKEPVPPGKTLH